MSTPVIPAQRALDPLVDPLDAHPTVGRTTAPPAGRDGLGEGITGKGKDGAGKRRVFRTDIQGLRAVAVLVVVLYHCGVPGFTGGYVGVDVFFVISGFLITQHLLTEVDRSKSVSIAGFYSRRIRRLLPPALLVVATTVVVARLWGPVLQSTRTAQDGLFAIFYSMNYRLAGEGVDYQMANAAPSPFQHFWSLAVEEQFYVFWPLLLMVFAFLTRRATNANRRIYLIPVLLWVIAWSLHESIVTTSSNGPLAYYSLPTRAWELGIGALVATTVPLWKSLPKLLAGAGTWIGLGLLLAPVFLFDDATAFPGYLAAIPVVGAALVIGGGLAAPSRGVDLVLRPRIVQFVGHVSYGWYLWHWPAIILGPAFFAGDFGVTQKLEMAVLALWFATLSYLLIEQPTLRIKIPVRRWLMAGLAMSFVVAGTAGAAVALGPDVQGSGASQAAADLGTVAKLNASIKQALTVQDVPSNLTPTLARGSADVPRTTPDGCHLPFLEIRQPACVYGDVSASRTMLLFGDSHAEQWFGALDVIAKAEHFRLVSWTKSACPIANTLIVNPKLKRPYTECMTWRAERMRAIADLKPDVIVASQADSLVGYDFPNDKWASATADTLRRLSRDTKDLVLLSDIARPTKDVPGCLSEHLQDVPACTVPSDLGLPTDAGGYKHLPVRHAAVRRALQVVDLTMVNTQVWFCRGAKCPPVVGRTLVYRDDSHMTQVYARSLVPVLRSALDKTYAGTGIDSGTTTSGDQP
ncbi:MAG: putative acyltransferase [Marmoricola sp.]|nr:putative acyltransferase [Marmoricola sp.]